MLRTMMASAIRLYPRQWRENHGDELDALIDDLLADPEERAWRVVSSTAFGAMRERLRPRYWGTDRFLALGASATIATAVVLGVLASINMLSESPATASPTIGPIPSGVRYPSGVDYPEVPDYVPDLNRHGQVVGYSSKQDLFPPLPPSVVVPTPADASARPKKAGLYMVTETQWSRTVPSGRMMGVASDEGQPVQLTQDVVVVESVGATSTRSALLAPYRALPSADLASQSGMLVVPVYAADLKTLVGHMYPGKGFVPLGTSPAAIPWFPTRSSARAS